MMAAIVMTINKAAQKGLGQHGFCRAYPKTCFKGLIKSISVHLTKDLMHLP